MQCTVQGQEVRVHQEQEEMPITVEVEEVELKEAQVRVQEVLLFLEVTVELQTIQVLQHLERNLEEVEAGLQEVHQDQGGQVK
jgi:hypothetical protein